ncbi:hypothetical protein N2605_04350 [Bradyrhizobium yuanmingense]|uniref:hypothetical protein n=1 Tax=Bradyrhizobium yuanmingense TaxID=108015 RepID=UPI0021A62E4C|nr:hypothetical protein [Bradyrhizobium sp. CB1024]UWU85700.1 hypothetical protein N2605_04350 [Bradyrhizobium sp. CB1024]
MATTVPGAYCEAGMQRNATAQHLDHDAVRLEAPSGLERKVFAKHRYIGSMPTFFDPGALRGLGDHEVGQALGVDQSRLTQAKGLRCLLKYPV